MPTITHDPVGNLYARMPAYKAVLATLDACIEQMASDPDLRYALGEPSTPSQTAARAFIAEIRDARADLTRALRHLLDYSAERYAEAFDAADTTHDDD